MARPLQIDDDNDIREIKSRQSGCCTWSWCCTCFFRLLQLCNTILIGILLFVVFYEYQQIQYLEAQLPAVQAEIDGLETEVQTKQQTQIQQLDKEVQEEHNLTFLTLAGIFTLLTCLISMFHMSSHLQNMNQPIIQRKIVAILWMSPIYSVTSFLSLLFPPMEMYLAIIKDFYESYCIYTFLSFLIAVLGKGCREKAAEVLARHADHMEQPTRCLSRWYDPPPETSDLAKASAVITECQIMAMQFVFIRPFTTVLYVIYLITTPEAGATGGATGSTTAMTSPSQQQQGSGLEDSSFDPAGGYENYSADPPSTSAPNDNSLHYGNGTRWRWLQGGGGGDWTAGGNSNTWGNSNWSSWETTAPTAAPYLQQAIAGTMAPAADEFSTPAPFHNETGLGGISHEEFGAATKAYFTSYSFFLTMVVNVSVFFAFAGLLKFYHVVHEDLKWCHPWPKFLTIKGVVFLTFWQGLLILIIVTIKSTEEDPSDEAKRYQNILICIEMLFFSITHWCVFPAEEWQKDYQPPEKVNKPGIGIQDFVSDVGYIVKSGRQQRRERRRRKIHNRRDYYSGVYHSAVATTSTASSSSPTAAVMMAEIPNHFDDELPPPTGYNYDKDNFGDHDMLPHGVASRIPDRDILQSQGESSSSSSSSDLQQLPQGVILVDGPYEQRQHDDGGDAPSSSTVAAARIRSLSDGFSTYADDENDDMDLI